MNQLGKKFEPRPFGKYFLTDRIAVGGMAEIYKAKTFGVDGFEKTLAIKKILPHCSADKEFVMMLTDEAKLVVNLSHTNIVQVYDLGRVGSDYFISMEHIDGVNLRDFMLRGREIGQEPGIEVYLYILSEVCKGLDYAHSKRHAGGQPLGIVHRDISPQNILVSFEGEVKIVDFGIAKAAMNMSQTNVGTLKGKVTYMSPEQALGKSVDARTDIFSCGIILYELLTGKRLFMGDNQLEVLEKIRTTRITSETLQDIPKPVRPILAKALAYNPTNRYDTAADMQVDLTRLLYSRYQDFSSKKLAEIMRRWFQSEMENLKRQAEGTAEPVEKVLISSSENRQVNLVHRSEEGGGSGDVLPDTVKPEDGLKSLDFLNDGVPAPPLSTVLTSRGSVSRKMAQPRDQTQRSSSQASFTRPRFGRRRNSLLFALGVALALILLMVGYFRWRSDGGDGPVTGELEIAVDLMSKPSGAKILLNGRDTKLITPALLEHIKIGKIYKLKLVKDGFDTLETDLLLEDEIAAPLGFELKKSPLPTYQLTIKSDPAGARIFLAGEDTQKVTPADFVGLEIGKDYTVELRSKGFRDYNTAIQNDDRQDQVLDVKLKPITLEKLTIQSSPAGASIIINGEDSEQETPADFVGVKIPVTWQITLKKDGFEDYITEITLDSEAVRELKAELKKLVANVSVNVTANITGATVSVDNRVLGSAPMTLTLAPGTYRVAVKKPDYQSESRLVTIVEGDADKTLTFTLKKKDDEPVKPVTVTDPAVKPVTVTDPAVKPVTVTDPAVKPVTVTDPPVVTSPSSAAIVARLRVDSNPSGASVKIDGVAQGITPILINRLKKGTLITVSVQKSGYHKWQKHVTLTKDSTEVTAVLQPD